MLGVTWLMGDRAGVGAHHLTAQYSLTCSVGPPAAGQPLSLVLLTPWALDKLCPGGSGLGACWVELLRAALPAGGQSRLSPQSQRGPLPPSWMSPVWLGLSQGSGQVQGPACLGVGWCGGAGRKGWVGSVLCLSLQCFSGGISGGGIWGREKVLEGWPWAPLADPMGRRLACTWAGLPCRPTLTV